MEYRFWCSGVDADDDAYSGSTAAPTAPTGRPNLPPRLELNGHRRRLTWEATPRSIHEGVSSAIMNSDCLVFDTSIAQLFADNGNLGINVTISMC